LCRRLRGEDKIGFDTEFVSEDTYRPDLCLVQVATAHELALVDALELRDLSPLWRTIASGSHVSIVHAGREELNFSVAAVGGAPANLFDVQLAAGLVGPDYPAAYSTLVARHLGHKVDKGETRTDWRRRPLSKAQLHYALEDVRYLLPLYAMLAGRLGALGRAAWMATEMQSWTRDVLAAPSQERWRRVPGTGSLTGKSLSILRELWSWREKEAQRRNLPPRRILRDDLVVEIAKRRSADPNKIQSIRGFNQGGWRKSVHAICESVARGLTAPSTNSPRPESQEMPPQLALLGQFLTPALTSICHHAGIATSLVGTASDVRDLIAYRLGFGNRHASDPPALAQGWRADLVGHLIEDLLGGKKSIRIENANSDHPLSFDDVQTSGG
jgi:ribonuclease D